MVNFKRFYERFNTWDTKKRACFIAFLLFAFVMLWAFISAGIITNNFNRSEIKGKSDRQEVDARGIIITETKEGKKYFEIFGETGSYSNDRSVATLDNVVGNFYKDGVVSMSFQSSKGSYDEKNGIITMYEHTYIVIKDGISLNTDKLTWRGGDKDTVAEGNVVIKKNNEMQSTAEKCIISPDYKRFKIVGKTNTQIWGKDKDNK